MRRRRNPGMPKRDGPLPTSASATPPRPFPRWSEPTRGERTGGCLLDRAIPCSPRFGGAPSSGRCFARLGSSAKLGPFTRAGAFSVTWGGGSRVAIPLGTHHVQSCEGCPLAFFPVPEAPGNPALLPAEDRSDHPEHMAPSDRESISTSEVPARQRDTLDRLLPEVYQELRVIARRQLSGREGGGTLSTTGLVHEAYLKLVDQSRLAWRDRSHFFALASVAMRHVLVDRARARLAQKREGGFQRITLDSQ